MSYSCREIRRRRCCTVSTSSCHCHMPRYYPSADGRTSTSSQSIKLRCWPYRCYVSCDGRPLLYTRRVRENVRW